MEKNFNQLTENQREQVLTMFDQRLSDKPENYTYEISLTDFVLSRRKIAPAQKEAEKKEHNV